MGITETPLYKVKGYWIMIDFAFQLENEGIIKIPPELKKIEFICMVWTLMDYTIDKNNSRVFFYTSTYKGRSFMVPAHEIVIMEKIQK